MAIVESEPQTTMRNQPHRAQQGFWRAISGRVENPTGC